MANLFFKTLTGKVSTVRIESDEELKNMTVEELKMRVCSYSGVPIDQCRLRWDGKELQDGLTLGHYGILNDCIIDWIIRLRGGGPIPEDEVEEKGVSRTESMEHLALMQQTKPNKNCAVL